MPMGVAMKWSLFYHIETMARFILVSFYHPAWDWNFDGVVNVLDLQLAVNQLLALYGG